MNPHSKRPIEAARLTNAARAEVITAVAKHTVAAQAAAATALVGMVLQTEATAEATGTEVVVATAGASMSLVEELGSTNLQGIAY